MSDDAVALTCASDALQEALDRGAGGASGGSGAEVAELRQRGGELAARCALHLARLQVRVCVGQSRRGRGGPGTWPACVRRRVLLTGGEAKGRQASASGPLLLPRQEGRWR